MACAVRVAPSDSVRVKVYVSPGIRYWNVNVPEEGAFASTPVFHTPVPFESVPSRANSTGTTLPQATVTSVEPTTDALKVEGPGGGAGVVTVADVTA